MCVYMYTHTSALFGYSKSFFFFLIKFTLPLLLLSYTTDSEY